MKNVLSLAYGTGAYLVFLAVFAYLIAFVGDILVPKSIARGPSASPGAAVLIDVGLLALFAVQHSVMARRGFKERWTRIVPRHLERSTYVLAASAVLTLLIWGWRPLPAVLWSVDQPVAAAVLEGLFWAGWAVVLVATFLIDHFRLFGLKQVWAAARGSELDPPRFQTPGLYRYVRHPLYLGFLLAFWCTPTMTVGHALFAGVWTGWILLAIRLEEKDLVHHHGDAYRAYRNRVRKLVPLPKTSPETADGTAAEPSRG